MSSKNAPEDHQDPNDNKMRKTDVSEGTVRPSIHVHMIRHGESRNNQVYRNARYIYRGGTPEFDEAGWTNYVDSHRKADPDLSDEGVLQSEKLKEFLVPYLANQVSHPVRIICSPMRRTLQTIRPTLDQLHKTGAGGDDNHQKCEIKVVQFYHESEGCHDRDKPAEGMNPQEISELMKDAVAKPSDIDFVGFPDRNRGWYVNGQGAETRADSEKRAAQFYLYLCEYLDEQLRSAQSDVFDAGVAVPGEEEECEHDKVSPRIRRRRTALLVGHGDFMSLVLKRIVAGFGHFVENDGIPHRSAFTHWNTGITELEYFGKGRFLIMASNQTPHIHPSQYSSLRTGGSLKDGWSYLIPNDEILLYAEVKTAFVDEIEGHVREQTEALKSLYLSSSASYNIRSDNILKVAEETEGDAIASSKAQDVHFIVQRGLQVVGVATYSEETGQLYDVAVRPSGGSEVATTLLKKVQEHARRRGRSTSLVVHPRSEASKTLFQQLGFSEREDAFVEGEKRVSMELKHN